MKIKIIINLLILILLSSCASGNKGASRVKYYVLDSVPSTVNANASRKVELGRVKLSDYLNQSSLLMRTNGQQLVVANYHSWAENLDEAIRRVLKQEMARSDTDLLVLADCEKCPHVSVEIDHFYPTSNGRVVLSGIFFIDDLKEERKHTPFNFQADLETDGYEHAVKKMRELLINLSDSIVQRLAHKVP